MARYVTISIYYIIYNTEKITEWCKLQDLDSVAKILDTVNSTVHEHVKFMISESTQQSSFYEEHHSNINDMCKANSDHVTSKTRELPEFIATMTGDILNIINTTREKVCIVLWSVLFARWEIINCIDFIDVLGCEKPN